MSHGAPPSFAEILNSLTPGSLREGTTGSAHPQAKFQGIAQAVSLLSKDRSTQVGALILGPAGDVRSIGYNGFPRGCDDNDDARHERPEKYFWSEHAERNAIYNAARVGTTLDGCTMIITMFPCMDCARAIVQSGIREVLAPKPNLNLPVWGEHFRRALFLFQEVGVRVCFTS